MAVQEGHNEEIRFALGPIELEMQVTITRETGGEAKIAFWVVSLGGDAARSSEATHTVRLSLSPMLASDVAADVPVVIASELTRRPR